MFRPGLAQAVRSADFPIAISERNNPAEQQRYSPRRFANRLTGLLANRLVTQTARVVRLLPPYARSKVVVIPNSHTKLGTLKPSCSAEPSFVAVGRLVTQKV